MPALAALAHAGYETVDVCGNIAAGDLPDEVNEMGVAVNVGARTHSDFLALLATVGLLVTSPGLTTMLEASAHGTPTVCLPPQNLSQILNGDRFALLVDPGCRIAWPGDVLDLRAVERARMNGEGAGLEVMGRALASVDPARVRPRLRHDIEAAIRQARRFARWTALADDAGHDGARQVAEILLDIVARRGSRVSVRQRAGAS
jgi:hydroxymethylcytosylglucuronate/cytosylglucuronate synthase